MANGWDGARPGSGRKKDGKNPNRRVLAARARWTAEKLEATTDAVARARAWLEIHEDAILDSVLEKGDPRVLVEVWKTIKAYAEGPPRQRIELSVEPSPTEILMQIAEQRRRAIPAELAEAIPAEILPPDA